MEVLKRVEGRHKITFPLLSDEGSRTIDAYGIRNSEAEGRAEGVPYPTTFLLDKQGIIRVKLFHEGYVNRHSSQDLIRAAQKVS